MPTGRHDTYYSSSSTSTVLSGAAFLRATAKEKADSSKSRRGDEYASKKQIRFQPCLQNQALSVDSWVIINDMLSSNLRQSDTSEPKNKTGTTFLVRHIVDLLDLPEPG